MIALNNGVEVQLMVGTYREGSTAVWLQTETCEPYADVSVYAYDVQRDYTRELVKRHPSAFYVKHWDCPELIEELVSRGFLVAVEAWPPVTLGYVPGVKAYRLGGGL